MPVALQLGFGFFIGEEIVLQFLLHQMQLIKGEFGFLAGLQQLGLQIPIGILRAGLSDGAKGVICHRLTR